MVTAVISRAVNRLVKEAQVRRVRDAIERELDHRPGVGLTPYWRYVELVKLEAHLMDELVALNAPGVVSGPRQISEGT